MTPSLSHVGQLPSELKLNSDGLTLLALGKCLSDWVHDSGVRGRGRAAVRPYTGLIDHHRVRVLGDEDVQDERALPGSGHAGDDRQDAGRDLDRHVLEVVQ